jgi:hypothetical protein
MKLLIIFFIFFIPFVVAENLSKYNETNIIFENSSIEIILNETLENVTLDEILENVTIEINESEEFNLTEIENETDKILLEVMDFFVNSLLEGNEYFLNFFEFLLGVYLGSGSEYLGDFFWDEMFTPNMISQGTIYSAKVGGYGVISTPVVLESNYCGDGNCGGAENCSTCPSDCGICEVEDELVNIGGSVGGKDYFYQRVEGETLHIFVNIKESFNQKIFSNIFGLREIEIYPNDFLIGNIIFEPFNEIPSDCKIELDSDYIFYDGFDIYVDDNFNESRINFVRLRYAVNESWIKDNKIVEIVAVKCFPSFEILEISKGVKEGNEIQYDVYSKSFSKWVLLGLIEEESTELNLEGIDFIEKEIVDEEVYEEPSFFKWFYFVILFMLVLLIIFILKHKNHKKYKKKREYFLSSLY